MLFSSILPAIRTASFVIFLAVACIETMAQEVSKRYVAITFDDLPVVCQCKDNIARQEITDKLLSTFKKFNMPVMAVVNEQKLEAEGKVDPVRVALLQKWLNAGYELGNHGYKHQNISDISAAEYEQEILWGERITRPLSKSSGKPFRFFRHPYLSAGDSLPVRRKLDEFLKRHNYTIAPNTITYQDYTFSGAYERALRDGDEMLALRIREAYLPYTLSQWQAAEKQSMDLFGREVKQILMVHANRLNADAFSDIATALVARGYSFISMDEALADPAYARPDTFPGKVGVTWLSRWAAELGKSGIRYAKEPVPQFVLDTTKKELK